MAMLGLLANLLVAQQIAAPDTKPAPIEEEVVDVAYLFEPQQNISAWELAQIMKHMQISEESDLSVIFFESDDTPESFYGRESGDPEIARHFKLKPI